MNTERKDLDVLVPSPRIETIKTDNDIDSLLKKIAALEAENKRLETWLGLVSRGYSVAINQLSVNSRMP